MGALEKVYILYGSLIEALYTLNSPPIVSFKSGAPSRIRGLTLEIPSARGFLS